MVKTTLSFLKKRSVLYSVILVINLLIGCSGIQTRLRFENKFQRTEEIVAAEKKFYQQTGRYGTLTELTERSLVAESLSNGVEDGYVFKLCVKNSSYALTVRPETPDKAVAGLSIYVDQTGVIRSSLDPANPADKKPDPSSN